MARRHRSPRLFVPLALAVLASSAACTNSEGAPAATPRAPTTVSASATTARSASAIPAVAPGPDGLGTFAGCDALVAHLRSLALPYVTPRGFGEAAGYGFGGGWYTVSAFPDAPMSAGPYTTHGVMVRPQAGGEMSLTPGRDDVARSSATNGQLVAVIRGSTLNVIDVSGDAPVARGTFDLKSTGISPNRVLLGQHRAVVIGGFSAGEPEDPGVRPHDTGIAIVDLTDLDEPRLEAAEAVTGALLTTSIDGDRARLAISGSPHLVFHEPADPADEAATLAGNRAVVENASLSDWLPTRQALSPDGTPGDVTPLVGCDHVRYPAEDSGLAFLSVLDLDLAANGALDSPTTTAVLAETDGVYATQQKHLWVTTYPGAWGRGPDTTNSSRVIASSIVHEFSADGVDCLASGRVDGWIPDTWALDDSGEALRLLGERGRAGGRSSSAFISVMERQESTLAEVHRYTGLDRGGLRLGWFPGYVATGQGGGQRPRLLGTNGPSGLGAQGSLDAPAFGDYLVAADGDVMLAISQGQREGADGMDVYAFDTSDLRRPRSTGHVSLDPHSRSQAETDAGYSLYIAERRALVIPALVQVDGRLRPGLLGARLGTAGALTSTGRWLEPGGKTHGNIDEILALPDGRVAYIGIKTLTVLDVADLIVRGHAALVKSAT